MTHPINFTNGDTYNGQLVDGLLQGYGEYRFANGDTYVGEFHRGKFHGNGTYTFSNGIQNIGSYINGVYQGPNSAQNMESTEKKSFWKMISDNLKDGYDKGRKNVGGE